MHRELLKQVVADYVQSERPDLQEDFDLAFDAIIETISSKQSSLHEAARDEIGFDGSLLTGTLLASAGWITAKLLEAAFRDSIKRDLLPRLDQAEQMLVNHGAAPVLVKKLRVRVEAI